MLTFFLELTVVKNLSWSHLLLIDVIYWYIIASDKNLLLCNLSHNVVSSIQNT